LGCSPARREIYLGFEDGVVKGENIKSLSHQLK
jgi:hypothetical protein